ncbi:MAG: Smr/MutS family protein [Saprospiraceae bacterium]|nr:Smr/MutS family protein [Saprospiraceae bacterium]
MDFNALKELWIGDQVRVLATAETGKFEGLIKGEAKVLIKGQHLLFKPEQIEIYEEPVVESLDKLLGLEMPIKQIKKIDVNTVLDLHLEKLPGYLSDSGLTILDYQLKECRNFIEKLILKKRHSAIIIHGKGEGILKDQVIHLLGDFPQIRQYFPKNNGGALEILLFY